MRYSSHFGLLKTLVEHKHFDVIRTAIDRLAEKMEKVGYKPSEIRRFFREMLARFAGGYFPDYLFEFLVTGWCEEIFKQAEERCDRSNSTSSLGLFRMFVFGNDGGIENCRSKVGRDKTSPEELEKLRKRCEWACENYKEVIGDIPEEFRFEDGPF